MTKAQVAVVTAALVVAGLTGRTAYTSHQQSQLLETENAALKAELEARSTAALEAKRVAVPVLLDVEREELLRLRGEVARLRSQVATNRQSVGRSAIASIPRKMERKVNPNRAPGFVPAEQYAFTGYGTPSDALQSHYWALAHPTSGKLLETMDLSAQVRATLPALPPARVFPGGTTVVTTSEGASTVEGAAGTTEPPIVSETRVAVMTAVNATAVEGMAINIDDLAGPEGAMAQLNPYNGHRVLSETEIDANTRELQVEREMADGTTRTEAQRLVRVGDEWKVQPGGNVQVMEMSGDGAGILIQSGDGADGSAKLEMRIKTRIDVPPLPPLPPKP